MNQSVASLLQGIAEPNQRPAQIFWQDLQKHLPEAAGSTKSHHSWKGGYTDHVQEVMNLASMLYKKLNDERPLPFSLSSVYLVLFLHDCEKPFRHATDGQLSAFPWISERPQKSDKHFQEKLIAHYGFVVSDDEWNGLKYVEGEKQDYVEGTRTQGPLAAFCHVCDTISARIWHDYPQKTKL